MKRKASEIIDNRLEKRQKTNPDLKNTVRLKNSNKGRTSVHDVRKAVTEIITIHPENYNFSKKTLVLGEHHITSNALDELANNIAKSNNIKYVIFDFKLNYTNDELIKFANALKESKSIKGIKINYNQLNDNGLALLLSGVRDHDLIKTLAIYNENDQGKPLYGLNNIISNGKNINFLSFENINFKASIIHKDLFEYLGKNTSIINLTFIKSEFSLESFKILLQELQKNKTIKCLNFLGCNLSNDIAQELLDFIKNVKRPIYLKFEYNESIEKSLYSEIISLVNNNAKLLNEDNSNHILSQKNNVLDLTQSNLTTDNYAMLNDHLYQNRNYRALILGEKSFTGNRNMDLLGSALTSSNLQEISFNGSHFESGTHLHSFDILMKSLKNNSTITRLNFENTNLNQEMGEKLLELLKVNPNITEVKFINTNLFTFCKDLSSNIYSQIIMNKQKLAGNNQNNHNFQMYR